MAAGTTLLILGKDSNLKKIAIIGASYLQNPLILKAKELGFETHVFAWQCGDVGEETADFFYPISITEKEQILAKCKEIGIEGVCTIASDLANVVVGYVASGMGLVANSPEAVACSTDKHAMRKVFAANGDPSPKSMVVGGSFDLASSGLRFPIIVKPADRSGSRGIARLETPEGFEQAAARAASESFSGTVLVEEFFEGLEYSVEYISWKGKHHFLSVTEKFTSGAPMFIEKGHLEPARMDFELEARVRSVVEHALDGLGVEYGASHSEIKINKQGEIAIIEIGSRMGGDRIGSDLVRLSTGYDFVAAVVKVAMGEEPELPCTDARKFAAIRYVFGEDDVASLGRLQEEQPELLVDKSEIDIADNQITDSSSRYGYFMMSADRLADLEKYLPSHSDEGLSWAM